jgi:hypothetical protein
VDAHPFQKSESGGGGTAARVVPQCGKVGVVSGKAITDRLSGRAVIFGVQNGGFFPECAFDFKATTSARKSSNAPGANLAMKGVITCVPVGRWSVRDPNSIFTRGAM